MGAEVGPRDRRVWGTWEELILGAAVLRHGAQSWNDVALELQSRTLYPTLFTPEVCKAKYEDLHKRYSGSKAWFEELRKQCVAELKQKLARSEDIIGSLESKIRHLESEKQNPNQDQTESQLPALSNSDGTEFSRKSLSNDENSAGSFTKHTRPRTSWLCECHHQEMDIDTKPSVSVSSEQDKDLSTEKLAEAGYDQGTITIRKRRGQRKRKDCNWSAKEGSVSESDNLGSSNVVLITQKEISASDCDRMMIGDSGVNDHDGGLNNVRTHTLLGIFETIAGTESAVVFRYRRDSQKRERYKKVIKQHVDIGIIESRILGQSIESTEELFRDLLLLANNALVFYPRRTREYKSALSLRHIVLKEYKRHCTGPCHMAASAFPPFNPPVKPRSARPRPKLSDLENFVPTNNAEVIEKPCDLDYDISLRSLLRARKGSNRPGKVVKLELGDEQTGNSHVGHRKRVAK